MCIRKIVAIDKDGTFTLPEEMMVALGLKVGDTLIVKSFSNGEIVFEKADKKNNIALWMKKLLRSLRILPRMSFLTLLPKE